MRPYITRDAGGNFNKINFAFIYYGYVTVFPFMREKTPEKLEMVLIFFIGKLYLLSSTINSCSVINSYLFPVA